MTPKLLCPKCQSQAFSFFAKFFSLDYSTRTCPSCGCSLKLRGSFFSFILGLFWLVPVLLLPTWWARLIAVVAITSLNGFLRVYVLETVENREQISFDA